MEGIIELSEQKYTTTGIKILSTLINKLDSMQEQTDIVNREKENKRISGEKRKKKKRKHGY